MGKPKRPNRPNAKGRNDGATRHTRFDNTMLESMAYASLTLTARSLLQELRMIFNGKNNGSLYLSVRDAVARLGLGDDEATIRAFDELQDAGFLALAKDAHFEVKASGTSRARCWRLTWEAWPECPVRSKRAPTNEWRAYQPPTGSKAAARASKRLKALAKFRKAKALDQMPVVESLTMETEMDEKQVVAVVESPTVNRRSHGKQPKLVVVESPTYVDNTMGSVVSCWWFGDGEGQLLSAYLAWAAASHGNLKRLAA